MAEVHGDAQVADFGLSRVLSAEAVSTGTYGTVTHMPIELLTTGQCYSAVSPGICKQCFTQRAADRLLVSKFDCIVSSCVPDECIPVLVTPAHADELQWLLMPWPCSPRHQRADLDYIAGKLGKSTDVYAFGVSHPPSALLRHACFSCLHAKLPCCTDIICSAACASIAAQATSALMLNPAV